MTAVTSAAEGGETRPSALTPAVLWGDTRFLWHVFVPQAGAGVPPPSTRWTMAYVEEAPPCSGPSGRMAQAPRRLPPDTAILAAMQAARWGQTQLPGLPRPRLQGSADAVCVFARVDGRRASVEVCDGTAGGDRRGNDADADAATLMVRRLIEEDSIPLKIWPATPVFAQWLSDRQGLIRGKSVVELGSGTGAAGLVAAALGARFVALTDGSLTAVSLCGMNTDENRRRGTLPAGTSVHCCVLKWGDEQHGQQLLDALHTHVASVREGGAGVAAAASPGADGRRPGSFDIVIGCDVFYFQHSLQQGLRSARQLLGPGGGLFLCASAVRSERMEDDLDRVPRESGFTGGVEAMAGFPSPPTALGAPSGAPRPAEDAVRLYAWRC